MYVLISHSFPLNPTGLKVGDVANGRAWLESNVESFDLVNAMYHEYLLEYLVK
jgi:hypothetical protein